MLRLALALVLGLSTLAWAEPADDLKACQAQTATLTMQVRDAQQARTAYVAKLAEMLAETRAQLDDARATATALRDALGLPPQLSQDMAIRQAQQMAQELQRLKAPKPEEKK